MEKSYTKKFEWVKRFFGNSIDFRMLFITKCFSHLSPRVQPLGPIWCYSTFYHIITRFTEDYSIMTHLFIQSPIKFKRRRVPAEDLMQINYHSTSLAWTYFAGTSQSWLKWLKTVEYSLRNTNFQIRFNCKQNWYLTSSWANTNNFISNNNFHCWEWITFII